MARGEFQISDGGPPNNSDATSPNFQSAPGKELNLCIINY